MFAGLYARLITAGLVLTALGTLLLWVHHVGAASVQARWDAAKAVQTAAADRQAAASAQQTLDWTHQFDGAAAHYEAVTHEPTPAVADSVTAAVSAGTVRLRDEPAPTCPGAVSDASARARAVDAAAAAAATQRLADSVAAVRVGDACDIRIRDQSAKIIALQSILRAERSAAH